MKSVIKLALLLLLVCTAIPLHVAGANIVTNEGATASHQPYIAYPSNTSYSSTVSVLNVSFRAEVWGNVQYSMVYSLDGKENKSLALEDHYFSWVQGEHDKSYVDGSAILPELANGSHNIKVFLVCDWQIGYQTGWKDNYYYDSEEVYFTVENSTFTSPDPTPPPTLSTAPTPILTQSPTLLSQTTPSPSPSLSVPEFPSWTILLSLTVAAIAALTYANRIKRQK